MAPHPNWTVLPHGQLQPLADNLWHVTGSLAHGPLPRAMVVVRRADGGLVIHNAVALDEAGMTALEALGTPCQLVVPNGMHRMDARSFKDRYPDISVVCPSGARAKVDAVVPVDATYDELTDDGVVRFEHLQGEGAVEGVMRVRSEDGISLVFCDTLFNLPHQSGFGGLLVRLLGSTGGPRVTRIARMMVVKDRGALREHLLHLADIAGLKRLIPGHGTVVDTDAAGVLRGVAEGL